MDNLSDSKNRRVLIIDDNRAIHEDFRKILSPNDAGTLAIDAVESALFGREATATDKTRFETHSAYQGQEGVALVKAALEAGRPYAVAFVDVRMPPGWDGVETTERIWAIDPEIQIVLCTAYSDYSWDEMLAKIGGNDRMVILKKPFDNVEAFQLAHALTEKWCLLREVHKKMDDLERMVAERTRELSWKTAFLEAQVSSSNDGILVVNDHGKKIIQNQRMMDLWDIPQDIVDEEDDARQLQFVTGQLKNPAQFLEKVTQLYSHPEESSHDELALKNGMALDRHSYPVIGKEGTRYGRIWTFRDVTERKRLEAQLFQSQKMETVGKLAGGVAHEFNSIMTAIIGQSELLLSDLTPEDPLSRNALEIRKAADRAASLTRQLLAYGRKQILQPENLDLNQVIGGMDGMFRHLLGEKIDVRIIRGADLKLIKADAGQIEHVVVSIAMNAHDAMAGGGKFTLETGNLTLTEANVGHFPDLPPGDYVMLAMTDTGVGMTEAVKARAFDPFFSTKPVGEGTGLGLATCFGIVKQSGGHMNIYSEPGRGTTLKIYLPQTSAEKVIRPQARGSINLPRGHERILLVEDDEALREMAATLLDRLGYTVLSAANGPSALRLLEQGEPVELLFTDMTMPLMDGRELADILLARHPQTKVLFTSAYTENAIIHQSALQPGLALLQKPFTPSSLAHKLREVLDGRPPMPVAA